MIIETWKARLIALAERPPYVFLDTPDDLVASHRRRLTTFEGYTESEVTKAEQELEIRFPPLYRQFLLGIAKAHGELFCGSEFAGLERIREFRHQAGKLMRQEDPGLSLPEDAIVFLFHQGYAFNFFAASGESEPAQFKWAEGDHQPRVAATSFHELIEDILGAMETGHQRLMDRGGYYMTLFPDGSGKHRYPAVNSSDRPLSRYPPGSSIRTAPNFTGRVQELVTKVIRRLTSRGGGPDRSSQPKRRV